MRPTPMVPGQKFGQFTVLAEAEPVRGKQVRRRWLCRCDCGAERSVLVDALRRGKTVSCGCYARARSVEQGKSTRVHGQSKTPEHYAWCSMVGSCVNLSHRFYERCGARGIKIHQPWIFSFEQFVSDVGMRPGKDYYLTRRDLNQGYFPGNTLWLPSQEAQARRPRSHILTVNGESYTLAEWSRRTGLNRTTIRLRLKRGWNERDAVSIPNFREIGETG
jgi:hypothetical protein